MTDHEPEISAITDKELLARIRTLTSRETEVLDLILKGLSIDQVALALLRSPKTIDKHCQRIYRKLGVHKRVVLFRMCMAAGYKGAQTPQRSIPSPETPNTPVTNESEYTLVDQLICKGRGWDRIVEIESVASSISGPRFFGEFLCALSRVFGVRFSGLSETRPDDEFAVVLCISIDGVLAPKMDEYRIRGTPCEVVLRDGSGFFPSDVRQQFPSDDWLVDTSIESYAGVRLVDRNLGVLGLIWIADTKPMPTDGMYIETLSMLAPTIAAELAVQVVLDQIEEVC